MPNGQNAWPLVSNTYICKTLNTDTGDPTFTYCPSDQLIKIDPDQSTVVVSWTKPEATDNSQQDPTVACSTEPGSIVSSIGTTEVTCEAFDIAGNQATCAFTLTVVEPKGMVVDDRLQNGD